MKHIIYKTRRKETDEFYIGIHSTDNIDDGYLGSGIRITRLVKKLGPEYFTRETLFIFDSRQEALDKEKEIVTEDLLRNPLCLNVKCGGSGFDPETARKARQKWLKMLEDPEVKRRQCQKISNALKGRTQSPEEIAARAPSLKDLLHTEATKRKISETLKSKGFRSRQPMSEETKQKLRGPRGPQRNPRKSKTA